jgi:hypothetical protein
VDWATERSMRKPLTLAVLALLLLAADAPAQGEAVVGLGLAVSSYEPGALGIGSTEIGPVVHIKLGTGLGPSIGFDWHGIGVNAMAFDTTNSFVWRPRVALWYDAATRVGLFTSLAYIGTRPTLYITTEHITYRSRLDSSTVVFTFGLVYGVF